MRTSVTHRRLLTLVLVAVPVLAARLPDTTTAGDVDLVSIRQKGRDRAAG